MPGQCPLQLGLSPQPIPSEYLRLDCELRARLVALVALVLRLALLLLRLVVCSVTALST